MWKLGTGIQRNGSWREAGVPSSAGDTLCGLQEPARVGLARGWFVDNCIFLFDDFIGHSSQPCAESSCIDSGSEAIPAAALTVAEWFGVEGTFRGHLTQCPSMRRHSAR